MLLAVRIGMTTYSRKLNAGISKGGNIDFVVWTSGISIFGILAIILHKIFDSYDSEFVKILHNILELATAGIIFYLLKEWRKKKLSQIDKTNQK